MSEDNKEATEVLLTNIILKGLESQDFKEWYEGEELEDHIIDSPFMNYVRGDPDCKSREEILADIKGIFNL